MKWVYCEVFHNIRLSAGKSLRRIPVDAMQIQQEGYMPREISTRTVNDHWRRKVMEISGENVYSCMQCGTCTASCPMIDDMAASPRRIMALIQFGQAEALDMLNTHWICASCHTCAVRCTRGIDLPRVMEALRQLKLRENVDRVEPDNLQPEEVVNLPQIAMVSGLRKFTS
jgi:heterodisulfide reductase subunit C